MAISYANIQVTKVLTLRGNTIQNNRYTGLPGEITVDTEAKTIRIHDGTTPGGNVIQGAGGASSYANANVKVYLSQFDGNIIPSANAVYSLGTVTNQWKSLFVSNSTIYVGGVPLSIDNTGNLTVNGNTIPTVAYVNTVVANVTVDLSSYALNANVTAANVGMKGYVDQQITDLIGGAPSILDTLNEIAASINDDANVYTSLTNSIATANTALKGYVDQANTIQSTAITQANLGLKGYVDSQSFYSNTKVSAYLSTFNGNIGNLWIDSTTYSPDLWLRTRQNNTIYISPDDINHLFLPTAVSGSQLALAGYGLGGAGVFSSNSYVQLDGNGWDSGIELRTSFNSNNYTWTFGTDGNLVLPAGGYLGNVWGEPSETTLTASPGGFVAIANSSGDQYVDVNDNNVQIGTNYRSGVGNVWLFYQNGWLVFPDNSVQTTAYTGYGNIQVGVYTNLSTYAYAANVTAANVGIKGYIDLANTIQSAQVGAANLAITAANVGMKGYVDSQTFYSNARVATYLQVGNIANVSVAGNVTATYFIGNGSQLTGLSSSYSNVQVAAYLNTNNYSPYSNVNVAAYLTTATITTTGNITAGNLITSGALYVANITTTGSSGNISGANYITANYFVGNGSQLTGLPAGYSNVQVAAYLPTYSGNIANIRLGISGVLTFPDGTTQTTAGGGGSNYGNGNVASYLITNGYVNTNSAYGNGNVTSYTESMGFKNYSNVNVAAYLNATGYNLYSNVNVASYLSTASITTTGNITAQYLTGNINITGNVTGTSANVTLQAGSFSSTFDNQGNVTVPRLFANGNVQSTGYIFGNGAFLTGVVTGSSYSNVQVATYLPTYSGVVGASNVFVSGNVTAQYLFGNGSQLTGIASSYSNVQVATYLPTYTGNIANIRLGVSGVLTFADGTTLSTASAIAGSNYGNGNVASYLITNGYVNTNSAYANGNVASYLITNQYINANSAYGNGNVTSYLPTHSGNVGVNNLIGTTPNVTLQANSYSSTFDIYGNVAFGNAAYPVQIYATGSITTNSNLTVGSMGVVMPNRPAFRVNGTAAPITTANVNLKGSAITTVFNQGSYFDATTGKFTAPIAGIYEVLLNARVGTYNGLSQIAVLKNGNNSQGNIVCFWEIGSTTGTANHFGVSGTINLVAGDYLSANIVSGNISFDGNDNWCVTYLG